MRSRIRKVNSGYKWQEEIKWQALVLLAINSTEWMDRYEFWDRVERLIPPHLPARKLEMYRRNYSLASFKSTAVGAGLRLAVRNGLVNRTVPIGAGGQNINTYWLRLTPKGLATRKLIKRYICRDCLNTGITKALYRPICGHCHGDHLDIRPV